MQFYERRQYSLKLWEKFSGRISKAAFEAVRKIETFPSDVCDQIYQVSLKCVVDKFQVLSARKHFCESAISFLQRTLDPRIRGEGLTEMQIAGGFQLLKEMLKNPKYSDSDRQRVRIFLLNKLLGPG